VPPGSMRIPARAIRSRDQRPYDGRTDLATVRVAAQVEVYPTRLSFCQQLRGVYEQYLKRLLGHATQGPWEVITAVIMGVVQTHKPDSVATLAQLEGVIHQHGDAKAFESGHFLGCIVITEHAHHAMAGVHTGENFLHIGIDLMAGTMGTV